MLAAFAPDRASGQDPDWARSAVQVLELLAVSQSDMKRLLRILPSARGIRPDGPDRRNPEGASATMTYVLVYSS